MTWGEAILMALASLRANKLRSALTLLGVVIGISSVITILTLGQAVSTMASNSINSTGITDVQVSIENRPDKDDKSGSDDMSGFGFFSPPDEQDQLNSDDIQDVFDRFGDQIVGVGLNGSGGEAAATTGQLTGPTTKVTVTPSAQKGVNLDRSTVLYGRDISAADIADDKAVALVSVDTAEELYGSDVSRALGQHVELDLEQGYGPALFSIVGVFEEEDTSNQGIFAFNSGAPDKAYVPYTAMPRLVPQELRWSSISLRPKEDTDAAALQREVGDYFTALYQENPRAQVTVKDLSQDFQAVTKAFGAVSAVVAAIAGISLLVGGIGVMNIMLVTVTERTREIGIRKALGARNKDIRLQFVVEAMIICLFGGIVGVLFGGLWGMIGAKFMKVFVFPPLWGVIGSLLFSLGIGLFFGSYPANKAAKLDPIEALRYE